MSDINIDKITNSLVNKNLSELTNSKGEIKDMKEISIFKEEDGKEIINEKLLNKEEFVNTLYAEESENEKISKEQLGEIFDIFSNIDNKNEMSENELRILASIGDGDNKKIDRTDIKSIVDASEKLTKANDENEKANKETKKIEKSEETDETKKTKKETQKEEKSVKEDKNKASVYRSDERIKTDEKGNKYIAVEDWDNNDKSNNCLSRIILNSYDLKSLGIKMYSKEYEELQKKVMDANPNIYGSENGGWRSEIGGEGRHNAVIYTNEKIILPDINKKEPTQKTVKEPKKQTKPKTNDKPKQETQQKNKMTYKVLTNDELREEIQRAKENGRTSDAQALEQRLKEIEIEKAKKNAQGQVAPGVKPPQIKYQPGYGFYSE